MEEKKYIGRREQTGFLVGLSGQNMVYSLIGASFFTYFMTDIALFPALVVSVLLIVMKVWDGVNDPIVGSFIDKHTFKNGEKLRPFLRYTPLPVGIFTVLLFVVFSTKEELLWLRVSYFVIMYICWDLAYTVQDVSIWGITAAVSPNSNERDRFVQWARIQHRHSHGAGDDSQRHRSKYGADGAGVCPDFRARRLHAQLPLLCGTGADPCGAGGAAAKPVGELFLAV